MRYEQKFDLGLMLQFWATMAFRGVGVGGRYYKVYVRVLIQIVANIGIFWASAKFMALSAKFLFFPPTSCCVCQVWYKLYRVSVKLLALSAQLVAPSWQKIANSNALAIFCQLRATQYKINEFHRGRLQWLRVGNSFLENISFYKTLVIFLENT